MFVDAKYDPCATHPHVVVSSGMRRLAGMSQPVTCVTLRQLPELPHATERVVPVKWCVALEVGFASTLERATAGSDLEAGLLEALDARRQGRTQPMSREAALRSLAPDAQLPEGWREAGTRLEESAAPPVAASGTRAAAERGAPQRAADTMRQLIDSGRIEAGCCVLQVQWEGKALDPLGSLSPEGTITMSIGDDVAPVMCGPCIDLGHPCLTALPRRLT